MAKYKSIVILAVIFIGLVSNFSGFSQESADSLPSLCAVYLTGIGCSNCAITDPLIFSEIPSEYNNFVVIEYEIYKSAAANQEVSAKYFKNYLSGTRPGVPFFILNKDTKALGRIQVAKAKELLEKKEINPCSLPLGESKDFKNLDLSSLPGEIKVWYKDRVLISDGKRNDSKKLKELLLSDNPDLIVERNNIKQVEPKKVLISGGKISFKKAVNLDGWLFQWQQDKIVKDKPAAKQIKKPVEPQVTPDTRKVLIGHILFLKKEIKTKNLYIGLEALIILLLLLLLFRNKLRLLFRKDKKNLNNLIVIAFSLFAIVFTFILAKDIPPNLLRNFSNKVPFSVFTFFIAFVDGFNPCNLFVLTLLLALLISASGSRKRIYLVGFSFVFVVFLFYFLFMVAWLNIFKYFSFFTYVRIIIGAIAILAGLINCKDYFFFKKGISLTIGKKQKGVLVKKMDRVRKIIGGGSLLMLILSSLGLAIFSSLVELPCTAGFPIIFTTILASKAAIATSSYYLWILLYNLIYILPLAVIVAIFGYTFRAKRISQKQIEIIKLIGGIIMVALGLILIINPQIIGVTLQ
ncbi:MAG: hypothetical protein K9M00_05180 [Candidatus Omnitrophica bacterium]|nr:hypothetical protein [Candidatus Omnitrophota bacterium]